MTGIKKINLISAVLVSLSLCGGCTLEKAGNSSQDQTVQEDNKTEQVKAEKAEKEEINLMPSNPAPEAMLLWITNSADMSAASL